MSTTQLISKLVECLVVISAELLMHGPKEAEKFLRRLQMLWLQERPLKLESLN